MIEQMKQYHFERAEFRDVFTRVFGEDDKFDFIDGLLGKEKDPSTGFDYQTENFKCFQIEEDYYILDLNTGVLITWYKGQCLGRINKCSRPDFTLEDLERMLTKLYIELGESYCGQNC